MSDNFFSEGNEVKGSWMTWGKPGDNIKGTLVAKYQRENTISGKAEMQNIYEIKVMSGEYHALVLDDNSNRVPAKEVTTLNKDDVCNVGGKAAIDAQMRNIKIGQIIGLKFMESVPNKDPKKYPTKVVKLYTEGKMDEEFLTGMKEQEKADANAEAVKNF
jgi:hypothetical protein